MNDDEIRLIVKKYLEKIPFLHSLKWEEEMVMRLKHVKNKNLRILVGSIYRDLINEIQEVCKKKLYVRFPKKSNIDDIVFEAFIRWWKSGWDGSKSLVSKRPELAALWRQVIWTNIDMHKDDIKILTVEYRETGYDKPDENDEANISSDEFFSDETETTAEKEEVEEESEEVFYDADEITPEEVVENLPALTEHELKKEKSKTSFIYIDNKRFTIFAAKEAETFYKLANRKYKRNYFQPSHTHQVFKPVKKTIEDETRKEFHHLENSTRYYKERFNFLKNAERRRWMEVAIAEMKLSKAKLDSKIEELKENNSTFIENEYRRRKPLLSAVAVDRKGNRVAACFKGGVDFTHNGDDKTWDLHCEFALFKHVIKDENMHLLKDGILYVTLEPCNKRGYWLDGEVEKPKIPCAVRCVQSGAKIVYVGTPDDNPEVYLQGFEILNKGKFTFKLKDGKHVGNVEEMKAAEILESYFRDTEKYSAERFADKIVYKVGEPLTAFEFDWDLKEIVRSINSTFLQRHNEAAFI